MYRNIYIYFRFTNRARFYVDIDIDDLRNLKQSLKYHKFRMQHTYFQLWQKSNKSVDIIVIAVLNYSYLYCNDLYLWYYYYYEKWFVFTFVSNTRFCIFLQVTTDYEQFPNSSNYLDYDNSSFDLQEDFSSGNLVNNSLQNPYFKDLNSIVLEPTGKNNFSYKFHPNEWFSYNDIYDTTIQEQSTNPIRSTLSSVLSSLNNISNDSFSYYSEILNSSSSYDYISGADFSNLTQPTMSFANSSSIPGANSTLSSEIAGLDFSTLSDLGSSVLPSRSSAVASFLWTSATVMASASSSMAPMEDETLTTQKTYDE